MTEYVYPKFPDDGVANATQDKINYMEDKLEHLKKLARYKKIKNKWTVANTMLWICGISVTGLLAGASVTVVSLSITYC